MSQLIILNLSVTEVFVEQSLALPGSAKYLVYPLFQRYKRLQGLILFGTLKRYAKKHP